MQAFETSTAHPQLTHLQQCQTVPSRSKAFKAAYRGHSFKPQYYSVLLHFNFTEKTKVIYKAAATEDATPETLEKGTHNGNIPSTQPSPSPNGLDSGQVAIQYAYVKNEKSRTEDQACLNVCIALKANLSAEIMKP